MAKITNNSPRLIAAEFSGGIVSANIHWSGRVSSFTATFTQINGLSRIPLKDFATAMNLVARQVASKTKRTFTARGTRTDPDEPIQVEGEDYSVTYRLFPKDTRYELKFTRFAESGKVLAYLPQRKFTDIPSMVQVAFIATIAADLMKKYEKV